MAIKIYDPSENVHFDDIAATTATVSFTTFRTDEAQLIYDYTPGTESSVEISVKYFDKTLNKYVPMVDQNGTDLSSISLVSTASTIGLYTFAAPRNKVNVEIAVNFVNGLTAPGTLVLKYDTVVNTVIF